MKETINNQFLWTLMAYHPKANCFTYKSKAARLQLLHVFNTWKHELGGAECDHSSVLQELWSLQYEQNIPQPSLKGVLIHKQTAEFYFIKYEEKIPDDTLLFCKSVYEQMNPFVVFFLLGDSLAFEIYVLTFWTTPSVPSSYVEYLHRLWRWNRVFWKSAFKIQINLNSVSSTYHSGHFTLEPKG